jgi:uncharacterized OB-fold protein
VTATVPWGPAADGLDRPYWDGLVDGELRLQRCTECREWIWGPQSVCAGCYGFDIGWESVEPVGTIYSWSRSWYPYISELGDELPYISVLVELPQAGGRRLLGMLIGDPQQTPRIGERVVGTIQRRPDEPWPLLRWHREEGQA